jgi:dGTP triphosphohydrolase
MDKPYISFSNKVFKKLLELKKWNFDNIYETPIANPNFNEVEKSFNDLYYHYLKEATENKKNADLYEIKRSIIDYMAGQTDSFFFKSLNTLPKLARY